MARLTAFLFLAAIFPAAAQTPIYLVLQKGASNLAYYSPDGKLQSTVSTGEHPHEMMLSRDSRYLYTTDNGTMRVENPGAGGNSLSIIDVPARRRFAVISLGEYRRPHGIDMDPATGNLAVTTELPDQLVLIDPARRNILKHFPTKGKTSHMVRFGPGAKWAYVSNGGSSNVSAINLATGDVKLIQTGERPEGSVLSKDGRELYVCNRESASLTVIDTTRNAPVANIPTGKGPVRIALTPDGNTLVYALMHDKKIGFADPKARRQTDYLILPQQPVSLELSPDGAHAFASAEESDAVYVISVGQKRIIEEIHTAPGSGPDPVFQITLK
ncbi:MAG: beta-propeller fold lactonase family protein [Bryobacteraceae bacterium]